MRFSIVCDISSLRRTWRVSTLLCNSVQGNHRPAIFVQLLHWNMTSEFRMFDSPCASTKPPDYIFTTSHKTLPRRQDIKLKSTACKRQHFSPAFLLQLIGTAISHHARPVLICIAQPCSISLYESRRSDRSLVSIIERTCLPISKRYISIREMWERWHILFFWDRRHGYIPFLLISAPFFFLSQVFEYAR